MKLRQHIESPQPQNILQQLLNIVNKVRLFHQDNSLL